MQIKWFSFSFFSGPFDFPAIRQRPKMLLPSLLLSLSCILSPILVNCEKWSPLLHHHHHQLEDLTAQESRLGWTNEWFYNLRLKFLQLGWIFNFSYVIFFDIIIVCHPKDIFWKISSEKTKLSSNWDLNAISKFDFLFALFAPSEIEKNIHLPSII